MTAFPNWMHDRAAAACISPATMRDDDLALAASHIRDYAEEIVQRSHDTASIAESTRLHELADRLDAYADLD